MDFTLFASIVKILADFSYVINSNQRVPSLVWKIGEFQFWWGQTDWRTEGHLDFWSCFFAAKNRAKGNYLMSMYHTITHNAFSECQSASNLGMCGQDKYTKYIDAGYWIWNMHTEPHPHSLYSSQKYSHKYVNHMFNLNSLLYNTGELCNIGFIESGHKRPT